MIARNRAQCRKCGDVIESVHVHDFKSCSCGQISVDGGREYVRRLWRGGGEWCDAANELSENVGDEPKTPSVITK